MSRRFASLLQLGSKFILRRKFQTSTRALSNGRNHPPLNATEPSQQPPIEISSNSVLILILTPLLSTRILSGSPSLRSFPRATYLTPTQPCRERQGIKVSRAVRLINRRTLQNPSSPILLTPPQCPVLAVPSPRRPRFCPPACRTHVPVVLV